MLLLIQHKCITRCFYLIIFIGNTNLEKWSPTALRRAGLCEDHFFLHSFKTTSDKKALKRNAVPIPCDTIAPERSEESDSWSLRKRKNYNKKAFYTKENIMEQFESAKNEMKFASTSDNIIIDEQPLQEPPLKTYKSAHLHFDIPMKEDVHATRVWTSCILNFGALIVLYVSARVQCVYDYLLFFSFQQDRVSESVSYL